MYRLKVFSIGKTKETWLVQGIEEYTTRLHSLLSVEWHFAKENKQLQQLLLKEKRYICLDPQGNSFSSEEFAHWLFATWQEGGARLSLVIGGAEGLPRPILEASAGSISLSPLTFTHQMTRLILLEQIFRAFEIHKGSPYHK